MTADLTSLQNPQVKALVRLREKRSERSQTDSFLVEGRREIERALASGYDPLVVYVCEELAGNAHTFARRVTISKPVFEKVAMRDSRDGVIAVFKMRAQKLSDLVPKSDDPLIVVCEGVEKPGNLGALLRSADGAGAHGLVIIDGGVDPFSPQSIRASLGTIFSIPVVTATLEMFLEFREATGLKIVGAALTEGAVDYTQYDWRSPTAVCLGTEATGLSSGLLSTCDAVVKVPMRGIADSLNVATAGAVLLYEALRQRNLSK